MILLAFLVVLFALSIWLYRITASDGVNDLQTSQPRRDNPTPRPHVSNAPGEDLIANHIDQPVWTALYELQLNRLLNESLGR